MSEFDTRQPAAERKPWQPLHYDKIAAAEAEGTFLGFGVDNVTYS